jgi:hypothetical protein
MTEPALPESRTPAAVSPRGGRCCPVVELRQYTLKPGRRDDLIEDLDRHLVEPQESLGMTVIGQFRDRQRPDRFVWLRGFSDMESRHHALEALYGGPVWEKHGPAANDTMLEWDDVLLLRPARPDTAFRIGADRGDPAGRAPATVIAAIYRMPAPADAALVAEFERRVAPVLDEEGIRTEGAFVTEPSPNTFTRLPVREGENVLVWFGSVDGALAAGVLERLAGRSALDGRTPALLELEPTSRSMLGNGPRAARASKHDFDFLFGSWKVHNRYLRGRLQGSTEWVEFESRCEAMPLLHGLANLDRYTSERDGRPFEGMTLRLFDPATGQWTLHWADSAHPGRLIPPMIGAFRGDVGEFFGDEFVDGKRVLCRFLWMRETPRWEQAFSDDGGTTWETNWTMTFTRE